MTSVLIQPILDAIEHSVLVTIWRQQNTLKSTEIDRIEKLTQRYRVEHILDYHSLVSGLTSLPVKSRNLKNGG
jgi:hypothetical protein